MKIYYLNQINTMTYSDKVINFIFTSGVINKRLDSLLKRILTPLFFILLTACGLNASGLNELKRLCEKDAGLTIYKTVEADGYYDSTRKGGVLWKLIPSDFRFSEFCNYDFYKPSFNEPGCWRVTKIPRHMGQCNEIVDNALRNSGKESSRKFREQNCITVEKIEKPTTRYSYHSDFNKWYSKNETSKFTRSDVYINDDLTNEILGRYVSYSYNLRPGHTTAKSCEIFEGDYPSFTKSNLVNTVIQPIEGVSHD